MTGHANDTVRNNLDKCVEIAEMSSFKLIDHLSQSDQTHPIHYYQGVKTEDEIANEGFPKFRKLPAELRSKVWENAMPPYGVYTALILGREEPRPQQPPPPAPMAFRVVYRLEPLPRIQRGYDFRMRLDTMRTIQRTCSEAASEVRRVFPTTVNCTHGKLRFNADHDSLALSDRQCLLKLGSSKRFERYGQGAIGFADDWHKIPRKMLFNGWRWNRFGPVADWLRIPKTESHAYPDNVPCSQYVEGFMEFLADCTRLRNFGFMYPKAYDFCGVMATTYWELNVLHQKVLPFFHLAPPMRYLFYDDPWSDICPESLEAFVESVSGLDAVVHGPHTGQEIPMNWQGMRFGRPELRHLRFQAVLHAHPDFFDKVKSVVEREMKSWAEK